MPSAPGVANPLGAFGLPLAGTTIGGQSVMANDGAFLSLKNNSGSPLQFGTVIVIDTTGLLGTVSSTLGDLTVVGVIAEYGLSTVTIGGVPTPGIPAGGSMIVQYRGVARVWCINTNAIVVGTPVQQSATSGRATGNATAITVANAGATIGYALEAFAAADTFNTLRVKLTI